MKKAFIITAGIACFLAASMGTLSAEPRIKNTMFSSEDVAYLRNGIQSPADEKKAENETEVLPATEKKIVVRNTMFTKDDAEYFNRVHRGETTDTPPTPKKTVARSRHRNTMLDSEDQAYIKSVQEGRIEAKGPFTRLFEATGLISPQ